MAFGLMVRNCLRQCRHLVRRVALCVAGVAFDIVCSKQDSGDRVRSHIGDAARGAAKWADAFRCIRMAAFHTCACLHAVNTSYGIAGLPSGCVTIQRMFPNGLVICLITNFLRVVPHRVMAAVSAAPDDLNSYGVAMRASPVKWDLNVCLRTRGCDT